MNELHEKIQRSLHAFINKIIFLEKKNTFEYEGVNLYPSEIHLILLADRNPTNATQMAEMLRITKGAVSQTINRLVDKGVILKEKDPDNKNELTLSFTPKGKRIVEKFLERNKEAGEKIKEHIASYNVNEQKTIARFLHSVSGLIDDIR